MDSSSKERTVHKKQENHAPDQPRPSVVQVVNPYATNRSSKSSLKSRSNDTSKTPYASIHSTTTHGPATVEQETRTTERGVSTEVSSIKQPLATNDSVATTSQTKTVGSLPPWQRLPSRNVSFGSAEILTVSELRTHSSIYIDRSVRITGVLLYRHVLSQNDGQALALVVGDPLEGARPGRRSTVARNPYAKPKLATKTPLLGKRKLVHRPKTPSNVLPSSNLKTTSKTRTKTPLLGRRLATPKTPTTTTEALISCLLEQPSVLIFANPTHVQTNNCAVGDLILVMGEMRDDTDNASSSVKPLLHLLSERRQPQQNDNGTSVHRHILQARILGNANGTDMKLHYEALKLRRRHLLERTQTKQQQATTSPILGCGPPPYDML